MTESEVLEVRIGDEHITPEQIMDVNIGTYGPGDYVLPTGQKLEAQLLSNNSIRIFDGAMVYCGVRDVIAVNNYHDVTIENGQQGMNRNDIIVRHFAKNEETQFGGAEFQVIKGTATSGDATDPEITDTDLRAGALTHDMKIYRARLEGLNVVAVEPLFEVLPSIPELNGKSAESYEEQGPLSTDVKNNTLKTLASMSISEDGVYIIYGTCYLASTANTGLAYIQAVAKRGGENAAADLLDYSTLRGDQPRLAGTTLLKLQAGDVVNLNIFQNGGYGEQVNTIYMRMTKL